MKKRIDFEKDNKLYYSLKEVANHFDVNQSLLRYWETEFPSIAPRKTPGGTRQYTIEDIEEIGIVYHLVREKGLTLEGARLALKTKRDDTSTKVQVLHRLESIRNELQNLINEFDSSSNNS